jgi:hypothetical protein
MAIHEEPPYWQRDQITGQPWGRPDIYVGDPLPVNPKVPEPFTITTGTTTGPLVVPEPDPCMEKHIIEQVTQYPDGVFGDCVECGERVQIPTVPGGYTAIQIRGFLERVLAGDEESDGELLAELGSLSAILDMEKDELDLALKRVEIARQILLARSVV